MVGFDPVVRVLGGVMKRAGQQLDDRPRERRSPVGHDLFGCAVSVERGCEEPSGRVEVATWRDVDVDDLAVLIDCQVDVPPPARDLHIRFVDEPTVPYCVAAGERCVDEQGGEALDRPVEVGVVAPAYDPSEVTAINAHRVVLETLSGIALRRSGGPAAPELDGRAR